MSNVCSELRRIWRVNSPATKAKAAAAIRPAAPKPPRVSRPATTTNPTRDLFKEPSVDVLASTFKERSASSSFRNRYNVYVYTFDRLAKHNRFSAIEDILDQHKRYDDITREGYAARLITLYGSAAMFQHAHNLFDELPALKCQRTVLSFNALLGAALHSKEFERVCEIFRGHPSKLGLQPDNISYNTVIKALAELGLVDVAVSMVDEMEEMGYEPDLITFNSVVDGGYRKKGFAEGEKVWSLMVGKMKEGLLLDIKSYNAKLNGMVSAGMVSEAVDLFGELKIRGLDPNPFTYNALIRGFCDRGDVEEAIKWYMKLVETDGLLPNWNTFEILVTVLCESGGDTDLAFDLSKKMLGRHFLVDQSLLQMVVDKLVKDSKVEDAEKLVQLARVNYYYQYSLVMPKVE